MSSQLKFVLWESDGDFYFSNGTTVGGGDLTAYQGGFFADSSVKLNPTTNNGKNELMLRIEEGIIKPR